MLSRFQKNLYHLVVQSGGKVMEQLASTVAVLILTRMHSQ